MKNILVYRFDELAEDVQAEVIDEFKDRFIDAFGFEGDSDMNDDEIKAYLIKSGTHYTDEGLFTDWKFFNDVEE